MTTTTPSAAPVNPARAEYRDQIAQLRDERSEFPSEWMTGFIRRWLLDHPRPVRILPEPFDYAMPMDWFVQACRLVGENIGGHVVWSYAQATLYGRPAALDSRGLGWLRQIEETGL